MTLCVIPARGGSKRIPRKNIKYFCGKPIIAWSIEAAIGSNCFDRIIVSTDDGEIASVAESYGAEIPFIRPNDLADDFTGTEAVIRHAIEWYSKRGEVAEDVCCVYATAPFVQSTDLQEGLRLLRNGDAEYVFSVTNYASPIQRALRIGDNQRLEMFQPEYSNSRSQDLEEAWHDAGQFYWGKASAWLANKPIFGAGSLPVFLPRNQVQDIDTDEDWLIAESLFVSMVGRN